MKEVYLLWFTCQDSRLKSNEEEILIGVYSSEQKAHEARQRVELLNGFKDYKNGFQICPYNLDEDSWTSGFSIV